MNLGRTYLKTIIREIKQSLGRFAAIFAIVALGVGFLAGLLATTPDMKLAVDRYFDQTLMMDIVIKATGGLTQDDLEAIKHLEDVKDIQAAFVTDALVKTSAEELRVTRIYGLPLQGPFLNQVELIKGRMPQQEGECLLQQGGGYLADVALGARLSISEETLDYGNFKTLDEIYTRTEYVVTGIVKSPLYISKEREPSQVGNGRLGMVMYIRETCYSLPAYTDCFIILKNAAPLTAFTAPYQSLVDAAKVRLETLGEARSVIRHQEILDEAQTKAGAGEAAYAQARQTAEAELAAVQRKLDQGKAELARHKAELEKAGTQLAEGRQTLEAKKGQVVLALEDTEKKLRNGEREIAAARATLAESKVQLDAAEADAEKVRSSWFRRLFPSARAGLAQYDEGRAAYNAGIKTLTEQEGAIKNGWRSLETGKRKAAEEFSQAEQDLEAADAQITQGKAQLTAAQKQLEQGEAEYRTRRLEVLQKLQAAQDALEEGRRKIGDLTIEKPRWYVLDRNSNVGCAAYKANAEKIGDVAKVFPLFFLLIAILVVLTTMTRMVEEERIQIGTLKALGYRKRTILWKYLVYCGLTGVLGCGVGMVGGFQALPIIIYQAFATMYYLPPLVTRFNWRFGLLACGLVLSCTLSATVYSCYHSLWEKPAALLLPRPPKSGKRIFLEYIPFIWKPLKFTYKVTARNLIRQKKHFFMTIIGIAGCTSLMVAAFGLRDSLVDIAKTQFEQILKYDLQIDLRAEGDKAPKEHETPKGVLANIGPYTPVHSESGVLIKGTERLPIAIIAPEKAEALPKFVALQDLKTKHPLPFTPSTVTLTEKIAEQLNLQAGDRFMLENAAGKQGIFTLSSRTENYVGAICYIGSEAYQQTFGEDLAYRTMFARTGVRDPQTQDRLMAALLTHDEVMGAAFLSEIQVSYTNLLASIGFVVLVLIFAAGGLAMIVLYNLTNININERKREIATLRVLGFHEGEAAAYIFREISVLSLLGAGLGLFLGIPLHRFIISVAENVDLMFGRQISPWSFVLSLGITLVFSAAVDGLMLKKIKNIRMSESMKTVD